MFSSSSLVTDVLLHILTLILFGASAITLHAVRVACDRSVNVALDTLGPSNERR